MTVGELRDKLLFFEDHAQVEVLTRSGDTLDCDKCDFSIPEEQKDDPARYPTNLVIVLKDYT